MQQPVHLREISSAAKHAKQYGMKKREFMHFAVEAFHMADSRHEGIGRLATSANNNLVHDFSNKNESIDDDVSCEMRFMVNKYHIGGISEPLEEDKK